MKASQIIFIFIIITLIIEIYLFIRIGAIIGVLSTILLTMITTMLGILSLRLFSLVTTTKIVKLMAEKTLSPQDIINSLNIYLGAVLLIFPGFLTDAIGLFLVLLAFIQNRFSEGVTTSTTTHQEKVKVYEENGHNVIEGEYRREDDK